MDQDNTYSDEEVTHRRDEAIRRALNTPPQPNPTKSPKKVKPAAEASADKPARSDEAS